MKRFGQSSELDADICPNDRVFVIHDLESTPAGETVNKWPLHCTILYPYYPNEAFALSALAAAAKDALQSLPQLHARQVGTAYFGPENDIPVALLESSGITINGGEPIQPRALELLHRRLMLAIAMGSIGYTLSYTQYHQYTPHVTLPCETMQLDPFSIDHLSVCVKDGATGEKHIVAVVNRD